MKNELLLFVTVTGVTLSMAFGALLKPKFYWQMCLITGALAALYWLPPSLYGLPFDSWSKPVRLVMILPMTVVLPMQVVMMVRCIREQTRTHA